MQLPATHENIVLLKISLRKAYKELYLQHSIKWVRYNPISRILCADEKTQIERMKYFMLDFKNAKGEIVMSEADNGDLAIHDEVLKESLEKQLSLKEATTNVANQKELANG